MNSKFYVSLEAEELLIEKGYPIEKNAPIYNKYGDVIGCYPADRTTKAKAIDWLDERRLSRIVIHYRPYSGEWYGEVISFGNWTSDITYDYRTRLEAEEAAIIKALKLLKNKN